MPFQILLVEEHAIVREGIKAILANDGEFQVMGEAENGTQAVQTCQKELPDVILMGHRTDSCLEDRLEATSRILTHSPDAKIMIFSQCDDEASVLGAIRAGVRGFVLMKATAQELRHAFRTVAQGSAYLSPEISNYLLERIRTGEPELKATSDINILSPRELQIMRLVADGNSSKEIATILGLCLQTVHSYRKTLMRKVAVRNAAGLTRVAIASGASR